MGWSFEILDGWRSNLLVAPGDLKGFEGSQPDNEIEMPANEDDKSSPPQPPVGNVSLPNEERQESEESSEAHTEDVGEDTTSHLQGVLPDNQEAGDFTASLVREVLSVNQHDMSVLPKLRAAYVPGENAEFQVFLGDIKVSVLDRVFLLHCFSFHGIFQTRNAGVGCRLLSLLYFFLCNIGFEWTM